MRQCNHDLTYPPDDILVISQKLKSSGGIRLLRTFHASQCICDMGTKGTVLCTWPSCGICNIIKSAFKGVAFGAPHNKGRCVHRIPEATH